MNVAALFDPIIKIVMILFRVGGFWMFFPWVLALSIPPIVRVASALALSMALYPVVGNLLPAWTMKAPPSLYQVIAFGAKEVFIGVFLAMVARWFFAAILGAAQWVGTQMGFSAGSLMNPDFQEADTSWAQFHGWTGLMLYFAIGGHFLTLGALVDSYQFDFSHLLERASTGPAAMQFWAEIGKSFFVWMLKLSGPLVAVTLILQAAMGVLSKFIPQINIWTVSIPITLGVGVLVFMLIAPNYADVLGTLFSDSRDGQALFLKFIGTR